MSIIFFFEHWKFNVVSENAKKVREKIHAFLDNLIDLFIRSLPKCFQKQAALCI